MDYLVLFVLDAAGMILELVASRLMSPYFGNSNFVWTAVIGIILLAGMLGNLIGGKLANSKRGRFYTGLSLIFAVIYVALTPLVGAPILESVDNLGAGTQVEAVIGSVVFFLIPSTALGVVPPIIMKERIGEGFHKGKESGRITAIIALGSLVGTFAGGFFLIPTLGTKMIFVLIAAMILLMVPALKPWKCLEKRLGKITLGLSALAGIMVTLGTFFAVTNAEPKNEGLSIDTEYGRIIIEEGVYQDQPVRFYEQSGAYSSATFLDEDKKFDLVFGYLAKYDRMFEFKKVKDVAMIGGAAYQYPKYYISHFSDKTIDVVEIDPAATEIAKKYFFLNDLIEEYGEERLGLYNEDGRIFMAEGEKKYDAVLNDAFSGEVPVGTLATVEAAEVIKSRVKNGGVYISNVLGAVLGPNGRFLRAEVKTLQEVFEHVYVLRVDESVGLGDFTNWMVVATDNDHVPEGKVGVKLTDDDLILTDDYCPIDSLVGTGYFE